VHILYNLLSAALTIAARERPGGAFNLRGAYLRGARDVASVYMCTPCSSMHTQSAYSAFTHTRARRG
jgi:hypothetical protein